MTDIQKLKENLKDLKILFVDDEEQIREGTGKLLSKFFDSVTICKDGQEGLDKFKEEKNFDIVIADIQMPVMNGVDMVKKIKEIAPNILTIFITASRGDASITKDLYDLYINKPISYLNIKEILQKASELND